MKQLKLSFLLCFITIVTFAQTAQRGKQNPPVTGIGVVVKKNPGSGANGQRKAEISCPEGYTMINGRCIPNIVLNEPWIDKETGLINYFEFTEDYILSNNELTQQLGVNELIIAKGKYTIERNTSEKGKDKDGAVLLKLYKSIKTTAKEITVETYNPRGENCNNFGNNCFYVTEPLNKGDVKSKISITPIVVNGVANQIKVKYDRGFGPPGKEQGF